MRERDEDSVVAIVGMSGRFPGADDVEQLWANLAAGVSGIRDLTEEELLAAGVEPALLADPHYVRRAAPLNDIEHFDAAFFGFSPREAEVTDPQHRLFLECCWEGLERAGYQPNKMPGRVGVFAGCGVSKYGFANVRQRPDVMATTTEVAWAVGNNSDSLSNMVSYKLGLTGPAVAVQSFCSTSLVAVHLAIQSLITFDSDVALAGGASLEVPMTAGYLFEEGGILSADGQVRSFDADAAGSLVGNGVGVVVLKRLSDARADGDHIYAVVLGSASNNDGRAKVGFTAPGADGQAEVIGYAQSVAGAPAETIGYVECHATGTMLGDSVELAAMDRVFRGANGNPCVLASLKPEIGHLDRASGVAGLIRAAMAVRHAELPGTRNFRTPNPAMAASGRFTVLPGNRPWPAGEWPRRAGVSSFGLGGTNAHVVLEELGPLPDRPSEAGPQALVLSARTEEALTAAIDALRGHLANAEDVDLADVAFTLQASRAGFTHRMAVICTDTADAVHALAEPARQRRSTPDTSANSPVVPEDLESAVRQWLDGAEIDWAALHDGHRRRVPLPTYPFQRQRYWIDPPTQQAPAASAPSPAPQPQLGASPDRDLADWFYLPVWRSIPLPHNDVTTDQLAERGPWWVLANDDLGEAVARRLAERGADTVLLRPGTGFHGRDDAGVRTVTVDPGARSDYARVIAEFGRPGTVLHGWSLGATLAGEPARFDAAQALGFHSARALSGALSDAQQAGAVELMFLTPAAVEATGGDLRHPEHGTLVGLGPVIGQEVPNITCRLVDVDVPGCVAAHGGVAALAAEVVAEACTGLREQVALRRADRWVQTYERLRIDEVPPARRPLAGGATVLITGGLGDVGILLAEHLAGTRGCRLVLTVRTPLPPEEEWPAWLAERPGERASRHIRTIQRLRDLGVEVLALAADVGDREQMAAVVSQARQRFGRIDAVIHGAGVSDARYFGLAPEMTVEQCQAHFAAKIDGLRVLDEVLGETDAPVRVTVSSLASILGGLGFAAYAGANSGMDAYARIFGTRWLTVNWEGWGLRDEEDHPMPATTIKQYWMRPDEGVEIFERSLAVAGRVSQLVISSGPLLPRLAQWTGVAEPQETVAAQQRHPRPPLSTPFEPPAPGHESAIAEIWCEVLGIDQIGANDNFFELGGHSLTAVRLMGRIRVSYGGVPISAVIEHPTVRELSKVVAGADVIERE
ncbi:MAG TPA: SDR family NAD(P)-dependent oxidoreductase [Actinophytocola sp.]|uniref:SDR family NAD(P)-dependent oxidoreductase n=1 Tax=Actinophytocola sp. TaxID=1872138 RepID=UPI002DDD6D24|nr:SDR family NAD(P)-dependent oxidoreductase [Actinophytocola sp.]HEV2779524.1 SDR family NAD(P)-dependent oxidoreductase [Actinophytocola sp.]